MTIQFIVDDTGAVTRVSRNAGTAAAGRLNGHRSTVPATIAKSRTGQKVDSRP